jgi:ATP-binding cassette subfamily C (CFTR/MRP) protein 10
VRNTTLEKNVLIGKKSDEKHYREVIDACALLPDLSQLPAWDQTEIGEKVCLILFVVFTLDSLYAL